MNTLTMYRPRRNPRRAPRRARAVALPSLVRPAPRLPSERGNRLVMAGLFLALLLGTAFFLGLMYLVING
ncbi:MAG: hypothetical protein R3247_03375 [Rhodothermales bacterium]|nr:hypothetical protein [Rhodothermales bacterium]